MQSMRLVSILIIISIAGLACTYSGTQNRTNNVLFADKFSDSSKKWDQVSNNSATTDYYNAAFRITVNEVSFNVWSTPGKESFVDTRIEVDATKNGGPDDNEFGVICRYLDTRRFYFGAISSDGFYAIMKMTDAGAAPIGKENMLENDYITHGEVSNHLRLDCVGSTLTLYVNGFLVDQQIDTDYTTGNVGLMAGTFKTPGTDMLFDNFYVYKPVPNVK